MLMRLVAGLWGGRRLRRRVHLIDDPSLLNAMQRQATALGLKLLPLLAYCERVTVPTVVGVLKPMILLPIALTSGLSPEQIESVLAHELAHLRRYDHLVNLLQRVIESLLFFHPAMWWVSHRVREEREHCCDDLVIACGAMPLDYAKSLLKVAELSRTSKLRRSLSAVSLLATGDKPSSLRQRISRLLGESATPSLRVSPRALLLAIGIPLVALIVTIQSGAGRDQVARPEPSKSVAEGSQVADGAHALRKASERATQSESPDPALAPTADLPKSDDETTPTNNANGHPRSNPAAASGDPHRAHAPSVPKPKPDRYVAELPKGVRVEFVGLAAMEAEPKTWWKPDGSPLSDVPKYGSEMVSVTGQEIRRAIIRVHGDKVSHQDVTALGMSSVLLAEPPGSGGPFIRISSGYAFPPGQKTGRFEVGIATLPQSPIRYLNAKGQRVTFVRRENAVRRSGTLVVNGVDPSQLLGSNRPRGLIPPTRRQPGALLVDAAGGSEPATAEIGELKTIADGFAEEIEVVSVATPPLRRPASVNGRPVMSAEKEADNKVLSQQTQITWRASQVPKPMNLELILIDVHGKQHRHTSLGAGLIENRLPDGSPIWGDSERFFRFDVPIFRVAGFEYRVRPYQHWVTFDNVALNPGVMTDVKVQVESAPEPRAGRGSPDPAIDPTAGLPNSDEGTIPTNNANGDRRSNPAAESGDSRPTQQEPPKPKAGEKLDAGAERRLKWGEPVNGLRAAMCIQLVTDAAGDHKPDLFMAIQNVSEAPIHLVASAEFPNPRNGLLSGRGLPQSRQMIAEPMPIDVLLQSRQVTFMLWIEHATPDANRRDGRSLAQVLIVNTVETLTGTMAIDKAPPGAWTGKLVTGDTSGADAMVSLQPKGKEAQSLFKKWQNGSRANGDIPGGALRPLVRVMTNFVKNNPTHEGAPKFAELLKRIETARDWPQAAAVTLLDEVPAIYPPLPEWVEGENRFKLGGDVIAGKPLPEELKNAPWGEADPNGLRVAWLLEPRALKYRLNTPLKSRLLFHNSGKNAVVFRALTWNQSGGHKAHDANGEKINVVSTYWTTIPMTFACRLAPGEFLEVTAAGIGVGANKDDEDWRDARSQVRVGAWIEAKAGDEVTFLPDAVHCDARDAGQLEGEEVTTPQNWWLKFIANRLSLDAPLPADAAERKRLLDRATRDLFGNAPTPEEITAFTTDSAPDALDALAKRLANRPGFETFSGSLKSGPRKFLVLPPDPDAAKKPRTAIGPGQYPLGGNVTFVVTRRPIGERIVNEAHLAFAPTDATKPAPREPHTIKLPDDYDSWLAAWMRGGTVLWVAQKGTDKKDSIRRYDFTNTGSVKETEITVLTPSDGLPQAILDALVPESDRTQSNAGNEKTGLEFLKPYPKLQGLSLKMTEAQFLEIVKQQELKTRKTGEGDQTAYRIGLGDGLYLIVMFREDGTCRGIQRVRGEDEPLRDGLEESKTLNGLRTRITLLTQKPAVGSPLLVKIELQNVGEVERTYPWQGANPDYLLEVIGPDGKPSEFINGGQGIQVRPTKIKPGETVVAWDNLDVASMFLLPKAGRYEIKLRGPDQFKLDAANPNQTHPFPTSNTVAVTMADGTLNDIQATFVRIRTIAPKSWQISTSDNSIFDLQKTTTPHAEFILRFTESLLADDEKMWRTMPSEYLGLTRLGHAYLAINPLAKTEWPDCVEQIRKSLPTSDGLEFLKSYPKLQTLSLKMTEPQFLEIVKQHGMTTRRSVEGNKSDGEKIARHINLGDGHSLIVMFDKDGKCSGIQRVRGDNTPKEESTGPKSDAEPAQSQAAERPEMELLQKLVRGGKIDTKTINALITLVAARAAQDAAFARLVLVEFEKSCEGGVRTLQSRRHLLAVLTDIFEAWSSERWRSQLNRFNPDVLPQVVPPRVDAKFEGEMLDRVIQHGYATDRSEIANASLAVRQLHHPAGRVFLRDVLRDPGSDTNPFAPTNPPKTVSQQQPNTTPTPKNNSEAPKTSRWKDNVGGGWTDAKFVAAVGLAELGESEGVEWLLARAQPNDFGIDSSLWTFPHNRDSRGSLMESSRLSLAELFGLPAQATTEELANWWRSNRTKFTARPATLKTHAGHGAPSPALASTTGLRNSDDETNKTNNANGVQRPKPAAEPEDQRRAQAEPRVLHKPSVLLPDHWIVQAVGFDGASYELVTASHQSFITIRRWDLVSMKLLSEIKLQGDKHGRAVRSETLKFSGDRKRVIAATDEYVGIWDTVTGRLLKQLPFETKNGIYECVIDNLDATPDLSLIVGHWATPSRLTQSYDAHVIVWDGATGKILRTLIDKGATDLKALDLSTDGKRLVTTNGSDAKIWDTSTGKLLRSIPNDNKGRKHSEADVATDSLSHVWSVQFTPDGQQLAVGDILGVKLIDTASGKLLRHLEGPYRYSSNSSPGLVFSKDGERLARLGTQEQVTIEMKDFPPDYRPEKDSKTKHRYVVPIWSTRTGMREFELHTEANDAAFTEDGQCLAVVFSDMQQALSVWQLNGDDTDDIKTAGPGPHSRVDRVEENGHYVGKVAAEYIERFKPTWGEAKLGLQYGIALTKPTATFKPGERVPLVAFFRNASDKPIKFNTAPDYYGNMPKVLNAKGELIALENLPLLGHAPHYHETLAPGEALGPFYMSYGLGENPRPNQQHWHPLLKSPAAGQYKLTHTVTVSFPETIKDAPNAKAELTSSTVAFEIVDGERTSKTSASRPDGQPNEFAATILGEPISLAQITPVEADKKRQELSLADYQKWLVEYRATALLQTIVLRVLKDYEVREKISPSDQELETLHRDFMEKYLAKYPQLDDEAKKKIGLQIFWSLGSAKDWRTAKALHSKYGGRVATSAFGAYTSIEGRNAIVKEYHTRGEIKFHRAELEQRFWEKLKNDRVLDVIIPADRVKERFATPPWETRFNQLLEQAPDAADKNRQKPDGQPAKVEAVAKAPTEVSLSDVIREFNAENKQLGRGLDQPVVTENEVITSIKRDEWKRGDPWSLNEKEITAFKAVAESKRLPKGSYLAVHTEDRADTFLYKQLWQVQLMIPAIGHDGFVGLTIRNTLIAEEKIDPKDVAWGKPDDEGLSLGAYFSPRKAQYALGERVRLRLFVRNDGKQAVKTTWANTSHPMPDDFTVTDNTGAKVAARIGHDSWSLPWVSGYMSGGLAAGETHAYFIPYEVSLGDSDGNAAKNKLIGRLIETSPGQKLQLKVRAHNGNGRTRKESEVEPESGNVKFAMVEVDATAAARDESAVVGESLGKPVTAADVAQRGLHEAFVIPVLAKYREAHREVLTPTKDEIQFALAVFNKKREANQKPLDEFFAKFMLDNWKLQKHLYDNFGGGRILWQQAGVEAFDAMRTWMEAQEKKGEFKVTSPELRKKLFHYWTTQNHSSFLTEDKDRIAREFLLPEWVKPPAAPPVAPLSLKGRVLLDGPRLFAPAIQITSRDNTGETEVPDESLLISASGGVANVAIYLMESPKGWAATEPPREPVSIRVEDNLFRPRLSFARVGQPLRVFGRSTAIEHCNFHSFPLKSSSFNVVVPWSEHRDLPAFTHAEKIPVKIQSDIQPWRTAYMLALDHPFAAITDAEGRFEMRGLPPGEHHFRVWHEQAGYLNKDLLVKVETDKVVEVELKFEREKFRLIETLLKEPPQRRTPPTSTERRDARLKIHDRVAAKELVGNWKLQLPTGAAKFVKIAQLEEGQLHFTSQTQFLSTYAYCDGELGSVGSDNGDFLFKLQDDRSFVLTEAPHAAALIGAKLVRTNEPVEDTDVLPVPPTLTASQLKALREERLKLNDREAAKQLVGHWKVALPAGFVRHTVITQRDDGCLVLSRTRAHSFAGVYAFVKGELLLIEPVENNVDELRFKLGDDGRFKLIRSEISSGNYTNTTLSRETEADSEQLSGTVMSINREQQTAIISVGSGDHVKQGMRFTVRFNSTDPKSSAVLHGTVEVTRITGVSTCEARIISEERDVQIDKGDEVVAMQ